MERLTLHLNLGLVTKGGFAFPEASPGDAKQQEKRLDPLRAFFLYSHLYLLLLGWFFIFFIL